MMNAADMTIDEFKAELKRLNDKTVKFWEDGDYHMTKNRGRFGAQARMVLRRRNSPGSK
jgi:hypothetical protein